MNAAIYVVLRILWERSMPRIWHSQTGLKTTKQLIFLCLRLLPAKKERPPSLAGCGKMADRWEQLRDVVR